jgi:DNA topoisomerase IB
MPAPKKYEHIDFKPPKGVASEAEKGLEYRRRSGKGGLSSQEAGEAGIGSGVQRAVNLKNQNNLTPETIDMMLGFFSRSEKNKSVSAENRDTPWEDAGHVAWLLWGGDAGKKWAQGVKDQMDKADKKGDKTASDLNSLGYGALTSFSKEVSDSFSSEFPIDLDKLTVEEPPLNMSPQTREELEHLLYLQQDVRPYLLGRVQASNEDPLLHVKEYCLQNGLPVDSEAYHLSQELRPLIMKLKRFYDRPRPYQLAPLHGMPDFSPLELKTTGTPSYPSGHTMQAFIGALYLADKFPEHREALLQSARKTSLDRMIAGVHFPSDVIFGEMMAKEIYQNRPTQRLKQACVIAAGTFGDSYCLFKNRDRNYIPEVSLIHEIRGGIEVLYLKDDVTGWTEGMNALGIGVVNSALMVARDETEFELVQKGQVLPDGEIILEALSRRNVLEAAHVVRHYKGGLLGHTVVSDGKRSYYVELPDEDKVAYNELSLNRLFTRTNHGVKFRNTGYTVQDRYRASVERRLKSLSVLREVESPEELAPDLMRSRDVRVHLHETIQDSRSKKRMRTTSQMVLDLTNRELLLYLFPDRVNWKGYKNRLPEGFNPVLKFKVEEYKDLSLNGNGETRSVQKSASLQERVAARYKEKKKIPRADGSGDMTVYVYSERQIQNRHREKAERLQKFKPKLEDLRAQLKKDLDSEDPKTFLSALAISLIDATYERVGNEGSAENGHYGVTGWLKKHVTIKNDKAIIRYVGKSGVKQEKRVDDDSLVKALKRCCGDKAPDEPVLSFDGASVSSKEVNEYLKPYEITAKDLRGLHANREMQERLEEIRKKGPRLPRLRKERDKILKAEFKEALEAAAEAVGHEPATLRNQYLVPALEEAYMKDGAVIKNLKGATKSQSEREDEHAEGLVGPSPKKKPPRKDLKKRRMDEEASDPDSKQDQKDRSQNYKDACVRVAARWLFSQDSEKKSPEDRLKERAKKEFDAYKEEHPQTELTEADFLARLDKAGLTADSPEESAEDKKKSKEDMKAQDQEKKDKANKAAMAALEGKWKEAFDKMELTADNKKKFTQALSKFGPEERKKFVETFSASLKTLKTDSSTYDSEKTAALLEDMKKTVKGDTPENLGALAAKAVFADRVALNPEMMIPGNPVASEDDEGEGTDSSDIQKASRRTSLALARFDKASAAEVEEFSKRLDSLIDEAPPDSPRQRQFQAMKHGLTLSQALKGDGEEPPDGVAPLEFLMMKAIKRKSGNLGPLSEVSFRSTSRDKDSGAALASELESAMKDMSMSEAMRILPNEYQSLGASLLETAIANATRLDKDGNEARDQSKERAQLIKAREETEKDMKKKLLDLMTQEASKKSKGEPTPMPAAPIYSVKGKSKGSISDWFDNLRLDLFGD